MCARVCRSLLLALSVALAVVLAGCGGSVSGGSTTSGPPSTDASTSTAAVIPTVAELDAVLLTPDDVPVGWKLGPPINEADLADSVQVPCENTAVNPTIVERLRAVTGVQFEPADGSYAHLIEFATVGEPERLAADLEAMFGALDSCGPTFTGQGGEGSGTLTELTLPAGLGDQGKAYVITGIESPESESVWYGRDAFVRVGPVAVTIRLVEVLPVDDQTPTISDDEFVQLVQTAVERISA